MGSLFTYLADQYLVPYGIGMIFGPKNIPAKILKFKVSQEVIKLGETAYLEWQFENAKYCILKSSEGNNYKIDINRKIGKLQVTPNKKTDYTLTCYGSNTISKEAAILVDEEAVFDNNKYIPIKLIVEKLDCDGDFTNGQKKIEFQKYDGNRKRIKLKKNVLKVDANKSSVYLLPDHEYTIGTIVGGIGPIPIEFNEPPKLELRHRKDLPRIKPEHKYFFDCEIYNYCEDGFFNDGELAFRDCVIIGK